ncbi:hypothetical protein [Pilimelia columellifera]|uniref:Uncharacterized protein n=1 Tax=Pilimelia columellifera subsp. columellifera TaxID=706583 RepID=A0ABN3NIV9_9ACTN
MTFPLDALATALASRTESWLRLGGRWQLRPAQPNYGKPVAGAEMESASWLVDLAIWSTGEAEMSSIRTRDDTMFNKHYELADEGDLEKMLDELVDLLVNDQVPDAAVVDRSRPTR